MRIIEFFGLKLKPRITRGKHMFRPLETGALSEDLYCIRDKDANCFLQRTAQGYLAIDSGYKHSENIRRGLALLGIRPEQVHGVFLTHLDIDHAGGMDLDAGEIFPNAGIYLSRAENEYLKGSIFRKQIGPIRCKLPIRLREERRLMDDGDTVCCGGVSVEAVYTPGHSAGHTAFRIGKKLFCGDCLIFDGSEGWCFYDFWNWDSGLNKKSLEKLEQYCRLKGIEQLISSHSGILSPAAAFVHRDTAPDWRQKGFKFIAGAEDDPYMDKPAP